MRRHHFRIPQSQTLFALFLLSAVAFSGCAGQTADAATQPVTADEPVAVTAAQDTARSAEAESAGEGRVVPDRLEIPAIDVDIPVVKLGWHTTQTSDNAIFSEWDVAEYAAGWHKNSALPGESGNIVMSGHNNILGSVFRELDQLRAGDETIVWHDGERRVYIVDQVLIVPEKNASDEQRADNAKWIREFGDERLTLVSCWPRNNNTHRIIVVAHPDEGARDADTVHSSVDLSGP